MALQVNQTVRVTGDSGTQYAVERPGESGSTDEADSVAIAAFDASRS